PFLPSDAIDITNIIDNHGNIVITKSNRKLSIVESNLYITNGLNENTFQQMLNKTTYHSNIYNLNTFITLQDMLKDIINRNEACCDFLEDNRIELANGELFHFSLRKRDDGYVDIKGFKNLQNNEWGET